MPRKVRLLPGEEVVWTLNHVEYRSLLDEKVEGTIIITNFQLIFEEDPSLQNVQPYLRTVNDPDLSVSFGSFFEVPLGCIAYHDTKISSKSNKVILNIFCKDFRSLCFHLKESKGHEATFQRLNENLYPLQNSKPLFAFTFGQACIDAKRFLNKGWDIYNPVKEFVRQNVTARDSKWRLSEINKDFKMCDTYPTEIAVPTEISDLTLQECAKCRSKGRIPVLSWLHPEKQASLTRAAQPMVGLQKRKLPADIILLEAIRKANANMNNLLIFDARPKVNAMANTTLGGGVEDAVTYKQTQYLFLNIQNIHAMRGSQTKIYDACFPRPDDSKWLKQLSDSKWLYHIKQILFAATSVADQIENLHTSVLVHCSDGWDRTAQITSLAMLMLDPYYRTIEGFQVLIEKEWVSFGHQFASRTGTQAAGVERNNPSVMAKKQPKDDERSPVFLQFIDCVWQILHQFKSAFEFNDKFLMVILDELYAGRFGNFLYDNLHQLTISGAHQQTISLWGYMNENLSEYYNPFYVSADISGHRVIFPQHALAQLRLWPSYYMRWHPALQMQDPFVLRDKLLSDVMKSFRANIANQSINKQSELS